MLCYFYTGASCVVLMLCGQRTTCRYGAAHLTHRHLKQDRCVALHKAWWCILSQQMKHFCCWNLRGPDLVHRFVNLLIAFALYRCIMPLRFMFGCLQIVSGNMDRMCYASLVIDTASVYNMTKRGWRMFTLWPFRECNGVPSMSKTSTLHPTAATSLVPSTRQSWSPTK